MNDLSKENAALKLAASNAKELWKAQDRVRILENLLAKCMSRIEDLSLQYKFGLFMKEANNILNNEVSDKYSLKPNNK